ncbi:WD40-repeat-containing domain protein [Suillus bovinus]|uniref:WD40-repeat-containing domain protein n=1 Tax=Suillus bovinus TaxID=48563 RepID=UPI001B88401B|nr:WD40-repeat-containing domain protein [Suillus bovinus]KAG2128625.1 WD40-repeat-containing domain protein [Suillus bovinus]
MHYRHRMWGCMFWKLGQTHVHAAVEEGCDSAAGGIHAVTVIRANCLVSWASMETRRLVKQHKTAQYKHLRTLKDTTIPPSCSNAIKMSNLIPSTIPPRTFEDHEATVQAVAVFPDKRRMVTGSEDNTLRLWDLKTGAVLKKMKGHSGGVWALTVSRDGQIIASGDGNGELTAWHGETGESFIQPIKAHSKQITSVDFSPDGTVLATGSHDDTVKFWCTQTWQMQGEPIECGAWVHCIRYSPSGELLAIATYGDIQIHNSDTRECVASFKAHMHTALLVWTPDGTRLLSAGSRYDPTIREWDTSTWQQVGHPWKGHADRINAIAINPAGTLVASASGDKHVRLWRLSDRRTIAIFQYSYPTCVTFSMDGKHILGGGYNNQVSEWAVPSNAHSKILVITTARDACVTGDLSNAEELLTQDIHTDVNDFTSYANRSIIMARKHAWDNAFEDAIKVRGYISKGLALCGKGLVREARIAFDVASMFTNKDSATDHFLLLIKAIALFDADQHDEAMLLIKELAAACPNTDPHAHRVVETYLRVQLGIKALGDARYDDAAGQFTTAVTSGALSSKNIHLIYEDLTVLFGWDFQSSLLTTHQKRCQAFLSAGKPDEALEALEYMMETIDETAKASYMDWSNEFKERCSAPDMKDGILAEEIPGQEQDGHDTEPDFVHGMHQHSQTSQPQPQQRPGLLKRLRLAMTRTLHSAPSPVLSIAPPPFAAATTFKTHLRHLFTRMTSHAAPPVVDAPSVQGQQSHTTAGVPGSDDSLIRDEDCHRSLSPDPNTQQQHQPVAIQIDTGEHGNGLSCCCC